MDNRCKIEIIQTEDVRKNTEDLLSIFLEECFIAVKFALNFRKNLEVF